MFELYSNVRNEQTTMTHMSLLYPQYRPTVDRRQQNIPVAFERRSGSDRRNQDRVQLDSNLTRDIFQVKDTIKDISNSLKLDSSLSLTKNNTSFSAISNMSQDQFTKTEKITVANNQMNTPEPPSKGLQIGLLSVALAGALFTPFIGPIGAVIAAGATLYVGARVLKHVVLSQALNKDSKDKSKGNGG